MSEAAKAKSGGKRRSLRLLLTFGLNAAVVAILAIFLWLDSVAEWRADLAEKAISLHEQARSLAPAVAREARNAVFVQQLIDEICRDIQQNTAPGHHIAVRIGPSVLQSHADHEPSAEMFRAIQAGAARSSGLARGPGGEIMVGDASQGSVTVYVSEHLDDIQRRLAGEILRRVVSIVVLGAALAVALNVFISRWVSRPLRRIVKGVNRVHSGELGAQVDPPGSAELGFLADEFNAMSAALAAEAAGRRQQMEKARRIQERLIPSPADTPGLALAGAYLPAEEVAGDLYDVKEMPDEPGRYFVLMADVSGHGVPAALMSATVKTLFAQAANETTEPAAVVEVVRHGFTPMALEEDFVSLIVVAIDRAAGRLRYASAGHEPAYVIRAGGETAVLSATGPVIGAGTTRTVETMEVAVRRGDRLVLLTDGAAETRSAAGEFYGRERLRETMEARRGEPVEQFVAAVVSAVTSFRGAAPQTDDITLLAVDL